MIVGIVDLGINNLTSVQKAFVSHLNESDKMVVIKNGDVDLQPDLLILPGLGKFGAGMQALNERNFTKKIQNWRLSGTKLVGICLGMQLFGTFSDESPGVKGLNLIQSAIVKLPQFDAERIPHIGWAETSPQKQDKNFDSLYTPGDFYFVHSYHLVPEDKTHVLSTTRFGNLNFASSVLSENLLGFQFHPEKSGGKGMSLISEVINWSRDEN